MQCRDRWQRHLAEGVKKSPWSREEVVVVFQEQRRLGNKWKEISQHSALEGRTDSAIKDKYYSTVRRRDRQANKSGQPKQDIYDFVAENACTGEPKAKRQKTMVTGAA